MYRTKCSIYSIWYCPWFQASSGGLRTYPLWISRVLLCESKTVWQLNFFICKMSTFCDNIVIMRLSQARSAELDLHLYVKYLTYTKHLIATPAFTTTNNKNYIDRKLEDVEVWWLLSEMLRDSLDPVFLNFCFTVPSVILKEWSAYKGKSPQTPELVSALTFREWTCPNLKKLWLGKAVEDKNRRMRAFLACMKSDTPSMLNPANVPTHLLLMCCVLR